MEISMSALMDADAKAAQETTLVPTIIKCSDDFYTHLRASKAAAQRFLIDGTHGTSSFAGLKVIVDNEMTGMEWKVFDRHGKVIGGTG